MENKPCTCPNTGCPIHGNCSACAAYHRGKPYCTSKATKKLVDGLIARHGVMGRGKEKMLKG